MQAAQAVAGDVLAVVDDLDTDVVFDLYRDRESGRPGMSDGVADRFAHNGFGVIGECSADNGQGARELNRGLQVGSAGLHEDVVEPLAQSGCVPQWTVHGAVGVKNRDADFLDDVVKGVNVAGQSLLHLG